jgi:hypothetical protein
MFAHALSTNCSSINPVNEAFHGINSQQQHFPRFNPSSGSADSGAHHHINNQSTNHIAQQFAASFHQRTTNDRNNQKIATQIRPIVHDISTEEFIKSHYPVPPAHPTPPPRILSFPTRTQAFSQPPLLLGALLHDHQSFMQQQRFRVHRHNVLLHQHNMQLQQINSTANYLNGQGDSGTQCHQFSQNLDLNAEELDEAEFFVGGKWQTVKLQPEKTCVANSSTAEQHDLNHDNELSNEVFNDLHGATTNGIISSDNKGAYERWKENQQIEEQKLAKAIKTQGPVASGPDWDSSININNNLEDQSQLHYQQLYL